MASSRSSFTGKQAWTIKPQTFKAKLIDCLLYLGVFAGITLVAYSLLHLHSSVGMLVFGAVLSPISMIIRDRRSSVSSSSVTPLKKFLIPLGSTLGAGGVLSSIASLVLGDVKNFGVYISLGVVLSLVSRYTLKKHKVLGVIKDYMLHLLSFAGVSLVVAGILLLIQHSILAVVAILLGMLVTPSALLLREKSPSKRRDKSPKRKFFCMVAVTLGMGCAISGVVSLFNGDWLVSLLIPEGFLLMLGGSMLNENKVLVSIKDIL